MSFEATANDLIRAIKLRRIELGLNDDEPGKLVLLTTNKGFDDWINEGDHDNATHIAMGAKCPLFQHVLVEDLPDDPAATVLHLEGIEVGFVVDRLDDEAWNRKRFKGRPLSGPMK
jgi:hypothetical protein